MPIRTFFLLQGLAALLALGGALVLQYGWNLPPCQYCVWQRYPYFAVLAVTAVAVWKPARGWGFLNILLFLVTAGLAAYHAGVEQGWWTGASSCTAVGGTATTPAELLQQLNAAPLTRCDDVVWSFLGLSLAGWNVIYAVGAAVLSFVFLKRVSHAQ